MVNKDNDVTRYYLTKNVLTILNEKIATHGLRVAYVILKMCEYENSEKDIELRKLIDISIFHDIGVFNTEEVKDMLTFETTSPMQHSTYGYLFLKYLSNLGDYSEIMRYHHHRYEDRSECQSEYIDTAIKLHFADRVDILTMSEYTEDEIISNLKSLLGTEFNPEDFELFLKANEKYNILEHLKTDTYEQDLIAFYAEFPYDFNEIIDLLKILVYSIDFRSEQTVIHTISAATTAEFLGKQFELPEQEQRDLYFGALLHDIGKICVPVDILESPSSLTKEEMEIMRNHVVETGNIIKGFVSENIHNIAVRHHEKCNGKGYPLGLKGEELTLSERIVAVSDVFCALVEKRSYKNKLNKSEVLNILHIMADKGEFDSEVVRVISEQYDEILEIITDMSKDIRHKYEHLKHDYMEAINESKNNKILFRQKNELFPEFSKAV